MLHNQLAICQRGAQTARRAEPQTEPPLDIHRQCADRFWRFSEPAQSLAVRAWPRGAKAGESGWTARRSRALRRLPALRLGLFRRAFPACALKLLPTAWRAAHGLHAFHRTGGKRLMKNADWPSRLFDAPPWPPFSARCRGCCASGLWLAHVSRAALARGGLCGHADFGPAGH